MDRLLIDAYSFGSYGLRVVSEEFISTCELFLNQLRVHPAIDNINFKYEVMGEKIGICIRRHGDDFLVSVKGENFPIED